MPIQEKNLGSHWTTRTSFFRFVYPADNYERQDVVLPNNKARRAKSQCWPPGQTISYDLFFPEGWPPGQPTSYDLFFPEGWPPGQPTSYDLFFPEGMRQRNTSVTTKRRGRRFSGTKKPKGQNRKVDLPVKPSLTICFFRKVWGNEKPVLPLNDEEIVFPEQKSPKGKIGVLNSWSTTIFFFFRYWKKRNKEIARLQVERQDVVPPICVSSEHLWTTRCRFSAKKTVRYNKD